MAAMVAMVVGMAVAGTAVTAADTAGCMVVAARGATAAAEWAAMGIDGAGAEWRPCGKIAVSIHAVRPSHVFTSHSQPSPRFRCADDGLD
jgi:hypothetical protein